METIPAVFAAAVAADPARPLLTYYDDVTGERTELSGLTLANWVNKTANLLVDGCGLGPGGTAELHLPPHWQTAAVLLGAWSAGVAVVASGADVAFADADHLDGLSAPDVFGLALSPFALPMRPAPPAGVQDFVLEVRNYGDHYAGPRIGPDTAAISAAGHAEVVARAAAVGIPPHSRVLVDADAHPDPVEWLLAPLAAGATIVLCRNLDAADVERRRSTERVTSTLT
jgi:uncharacterized protein (TIGR03089 family)